MNLEDEHAAQKADNTSSTETASPSKPASFFQERCPQVVEVAPHLLRLRTRRDLLLFGMGAMVAIAGGGSLLPEATLERLGIIQGNKNWPKEEWLLNRALRIDDDVAEALYSRNRLVPTYTKSQITPLKNNYNVDGLSSADPARDSPERKASRSRARSSAATGRTCETRSEEHQGDYEDYVYEGRTAGLLGKARVFTL